MGQPGKRKGLSVTASITDDQVQTFRALTTTASGPGRESSFASIVLNLIAECAAAVGADWDSLKSGIPGYQEAMAARRRRAAAEQLHSGDTLRECQDMLARLSPRTIDRYHAQLWRDTVESQSPKDPKPGRQTAV